MSRVTKEDGQDYQAIEKKLDRMNKKIKRSQRRVFSCFNCLIYLVVLILVFIFFIMFLLAKSGLKEVPVFSNLFFEVPSYTRLITPASSSEIDKVISSQIKTQLPRVITSKGVPVTIKLSEELITGKLHDIFHSTDKNEDVKVAQAAILDEGIELYIYRLPSTYFKLVINPEYDNDLSLVITDFKLGNLNLPKGLGGWLLNSLVANRFDQFNKWFASFGSVSDVRIHSGEIEIDVKITDKSKYLNVLN